MNSNETSTLINPNNAPEILSFYPNRIKMNPLTISRKIVKNSLLSSNYFRSISRHIVYFLCRNRNNIFVDSKGYHCRFELLNQYRREKIQRRKIVNETFTVLTTCNNGYRMFSLIFDYIFKNGIVRTLLVIWGSVSHGCSFNWYSNIWVYILFCISVKSLWNKTF